MSDEAFQTHLQLEDSVQTLTKDIQMLKSDKAALENQFKSLNAIVSNPDSLSDDRLRESLQHEALLENLD